VSELKTTILNLASKDMTREEYESIHGKVRSVLGSDAASIFSHAVESEAEQFFVGQPDELPSLWSRMMWLAHEEGKA
jgi:hypothetical protein